MSEAVVLATAVGAASGSKAAAAALACAGSEPDRPSLLIDLGGRAPRPVAAGTDKWPRPAGAQLPQCRRLPRARHPLK